MNVNIMMLVCSTKSLTYTKFLLNCSPIETDCPNFTSRSTKMKKGKLINYYFKNVDTMGQVI